MTRLIGFSAACLGIVAAVFLLVQLTVGFGTVGLSGHGIAAMIIGVTLTSALAVGLMALIFHSHRTQQDEIVHHGGIRRD